MFFSALIVTFSAPDSCSVDRSTFWFICGSAAIRCGLICRNSKASLKGCYLTWPLFPNPSLFPCHTTPHLHPIISPPWTSGLSYSPSLFPFCFSVSSVRPSLPLSCNEACPWEMRWSRNHFTGCSEPQVHLSCATMGTLAFNSSAAPTVWRHPNWHLIQRTKDKSH